MSYENEIAISAFYMIMIIIIIIIIIIINDVLVDSSLEEGSICAQK